MARILRPETGGDASSGGRREGVRHGRADADVPGGTNELMKYIADHLKYPTIAQENGVEGRVICQLWLAVTVEYGMLKL